MILSEKYQKSIFFFFLIQVSLEGLFFELEKLLFEAKPTNTFALQNICKAKSLESIL